MSDKTEDRPELGTTEAAVRSCVSLMAAVFGQREELLAYWLDLYYQVRAAYERERAKEETLVDLLTLADQKLADLRASVATPEGASARNDGEDDTSSAQRAPSPQGEGNEETTDAEEGNGADESAPPRESGLSGFEPVAPPIGPWTKFKRLVLEQLKKARADGVDFPTIIKASDGALSREDILGALNAAKLPRETWKELDAALQRLGTD